MSWLGAQPDTHQATQSPQLKAKSTIRSEKAGKSCNHDVLRFDRLFGRKSVKAIPPKQKCKVSVVAALKARILHITDFTRRRLQTKQHEEAK